MGRICSLQGDDQQTTTALTLAQAHSGSVWKLAWAHPEFGQVLVTCSYDFTCVVWEEQEAGARGKGPAWIERARLGGLMSSC